MQKNLIKKLFAAVVIASLVLGMFLEFAVRAESPVAVQSPATAQSAVWVRSAVAAQSPATAQSSVAAQTVRTSGAKSMVYPKNQVTHAGEKAKIDVFLVDEAGNPLSGHSVDLVSSFGEETITTVAAGKVTDANGKISFEIQSAAEKTVTYTAYDTTSNVAVQSKAKVAFFNTNSYLFANVLGDSVGAPSGPATQLLFEDMPASVKVNETATLTLTAYDVADQQAQDYLGTVRFSVTSDNFTYASLPADYTFTVSDQGSHAFSLSFLFQQVGVYELEARDTITAALVGEADVNVVAGGSLAAGVSTISLTTPTAGSYSNAVQVISGTAPAASVLQIFDNELKIGQVTAGADGKFTFTSGSLAEGEHEFYVASVNEVGTIIDASAKVKITLDTSAPEIQNIEMEPGDVVDPNSQVKLKLYIQEDLSAASMVIDNNTYDFADNPFGYLEANFASPLEFGEYPIDILVTDTLGNQSQLKNAALLKVGRIYGVGSLWTVTGLSAESKNGKVYLKWNPLDGVVDHYRIYYGTSADQLIHAVDTWTAATNWYIPNLPAGMTQYFAVVAVDIDNQTSATYSNVAQAVPDFTSPWVENGVDGSDALDDMETEVSQTGPGVLWLVALSLLGGMGYTFFKKEKVC